MNLNPLTRVGRRWICPIGALLMIGLLAAGCRGVPTNAEKAARQQAQSVAGARLLEGARPPVSTLTTNSTLEDLLRFAMLNHPQVEAAYQDWLASVERITQARSFPDPQLAFQMDIQKVVTSVMPGLMGAFPWPGKLRVGAEIASAESQAKYSTFQSVTLQTAFEVKRACYRLDLLERKIVVNRDTLRLLNDLEKLARAQNDVGKVTLQDVLRAQIEQDRLRAEIANLEDSRGAFLAQFKAALGIAPHEPTPPIPRNLESTPLDLDADKLLETALTQNQRLKSMESDVRAAEASISLARKARLPDFSLGFMVDAKTDPTLYRLPGNPGALSLPIWRDKIAAQIAEAQANKRSAEARLSAEQIALAASIAEASYVYREATRNLALLNEQLLPKARRSLEVARSGYLSGQIDFFNLTDSERTLLGFELERIEAANQRELALAELSLIVQGMSPVGGATPSGSGPNTPSVQKATAGGM